MNPNAADDARERRRRRRFWKIIYDPDTYWERCVSKYGPIMAEAFVEVRENCLVRLMSCRDLLPPEAMELKCVDILLGRRKLKEEKII